MIETLEKKVEWDGNNQSAADQHQHPIFFAVCVIGALLGLSVLIALSPHEFVNDEELHLRGAYLLGNVDDVTHMKNPRPGISIHEMLLAPLPSAPGPLYAVLHVALYPLTKLEMPQVRYVNLGLFLLSLAAVGFSLRRWRIQHPWLLAALMLAVPLTWTTVGLALTEIPAVTMTAFGLAAAAWATTRAKEKRWQEYVGFGLAGIFAGLAILGRQTNLPVIAAFVAVAIASRRWRWPALIACLMASLIPLPVFITWGALTRESQASVGNGISISIEHGVVAFAYLSMILYWLAPDFFRAGGRWSLAAAGMGVVLNVAFFHFDWKMRDGLLGILSRALGSYYSIIAGSLFIAAFMGFAVAAIINLWTCRNNGLFVFGLGQVILLTGTALGIVHAFFPRYLATGLPFIALVVQPFFTPSKWTAVRFVVGSVLGAASLALIYFFSGVAT
jgi:hypothetical protein